MSRVRLGGGDDLPAVLAIDAGNSKTDVALIAADGTLLSAARGPGMPRTVDSETSLRMLASLVDRIQHGIGQHGLPAAWHTSACVANLDLPEEEEQLAEALRGQGLSITSEAVNDTFAVLRAGVNGTESGVDGKLPREERFRPWGVAVVCGTGINCVGLDPSGRTFRFLALGDISGDWGGGQFLSRAALWCAVRAEDGRGPETALREAVASHFGVASVREVAIGIHVGRIAESGLLGLAPVLLAVAGAGDRVARKLVTRQATEVAAMALVAMRRLDLVGSATPVVLGGGVLTAHDELLIAGITEAIVAEAPNAVVRVTPVPPVAGAGLLGLDQAGAGIEAERRLRAAYSHPSHREHI